MDDHLEFNIVIPGRQVHEAEVVFNENTSYVFSANYLPVFPGPGRICSNQATSLRNIQIM